MRVVRSYGSKRGVVVTGIRGKLGMVMERLQCSVCNGTVREVIYGVVGL